MALYDSADCLQRCKDAAQLPTIDEAMPDAAWFRLLTAAQARWFHTLAAMVPGALYSEPVSLALTGSPDGVTFDFGTDEDDRVIVPYGQIELYRRESDARQPDARQRYALRAGVDFSMYGERIVLSPTSPVALDDAGPWARYISPPDIIDASHAPTLLPVPARELLVLSAVEAWAKQGGLRDATPYTGAADARWRGTGPGDPGLLGALRLQYYAPAAPRSGGFGAARVFGRDLVRAY